MKKGLFSLFVFSLLLMSVQVVFAETINYEWGDYFELISDDGYSYKHVLYDVEKVDDGYLFIGSDVLRLYDKSGKLIKDNYQIDDSLYCSYYYYSDEDSNQYFGYASWSEYDENDEYLGYQQGYIILDENCKEIKKVADDDFHYWDAMNNYKDYYVLIDFDDWSTTLIKKDLSSVEHFYRGDLTDKELRDYWGDYYTMVVASESDKDDSREYRIFRINDKYVALAYYDSSSRTYGLAMYDKEYNLLFEQGGFSKHFLVELVDDGYYLLDEKNIDSRRECSAKDYDETCSSQLILYKYDYSNNKIYEENLSKLISWRYDYSYGEGNKASTLKIMDGKLFILINYSYAPSSLDEEKTGVQPAVLVYSFTYDIEYKTDGNGEIKAINSSKAGDNVTFTVTPNDGYVLEKVKVTDKSGNTITFTDYRFTMPSSDVVIEASFKSADNPDTSDIAIIGCIIIIILGVALTFLNIRKVKELE